MMRDTFAVEMLLAGVSLEEVAVLLGHSNTKVGMGARPSGAIGAIRSNGVGGGCFKCQPHGGGAILSRDQLGVVQ